MPKLNAPLPNEPIFHHAEPTFAHKLNQMMEAVREMQDHLNGEADAEPEKPLTAAQRKKLEAEQKKAEEEAAKQAENPTPSE